jgi:hypothetical protein
LLVLLLVDTNGRDVIYDALLALRFRLAAAFDAALHFTILGLFCKK